MSIKTYKNLGFLGLEPGSNVSLGAMLALLYKTDFNKLFA